MDKKPLSEGFGAEITGIDARVPLTKEACSFIVAALYEHGAVCLRNQSLEPAELQAFGAHLGTPIHHVEEDLRVEGEPGVMVLSNADGRPERQRNGGAFWHTDLVFTEEPASFTMLNAVAVPASGGETLFAGQLAAFEALPGRLKARAETAVFAHCYEGRTDGSMPTVYHPLVRPHPVTGRKALYGAAGTCIGVEGMSGTEARGFLDEIGDHASDAKFQYAHLYRINDLVIWDNAVTLHSGPILEEASGAADTRIMNRVSVRGWPQPNLRQ
ncbi:MAG: TauD/TfdA family dioxygenase [Alphaproteobacteria bacterium]|nr:TauD/TfdA family dioxygenase [Alphaproteobacteria bacterium]